MEKAYEKNANKLTSCNIKKISEIDVKEILHNASITIMNHLTRIGLIKDEEIIEHPALDKLFQEHPELESHYQEALHLPVTPFSRLIAPGFGYESEGAIKKGRLCYTQNGFQIHANTKVNPLDREGLDRLLGYMARPAISEQRLEIAKDQITYQLKRPWSDGRTQVTYKPMVFMRRLASLIPRPKIHLIRHAGVFAPASPMRKLIVPNPEATKVFRARCKDLTVEEKKERRKVKNHSWARMLAKVFEIDVGTCEKCGDDMIIVSMIRDYGVAEQYLRHVKLWDSTGPPEPESTEDEVFYLEPVTD